MLFVLYIRVFLFVCAMLGSMRLLYMACLVDKLCCLELYPEVFGLEGSAYFGLRVVKLLGAYVYVIDEMIRCFLFEAFHPPILLWRTRAR